MASSSQVTYEKGGSHRAPNLILQDHWFQVPLDYAKPDSHSLRIFAREVVSAKASSEKLPYLIYLQGGPGFESPRPTDEGGWLKKACEKHRVLLLDQRGTGLSSSISAAALSAIGSPSKQAEFLTHFRQDNIVRDCESIRIALKVTQWTVLGQSFGGFCTLTYLSLAPESIKTALITGGLAPVSYGCTADAVYMALYGQVILQNQKYYARFPEDAALVRSIVLHLADSPSLSVPLPSGGVLTPRGLQLLGLSGLGSAGGFERLHYLLERAWDACLPGGPDESGKSRKLSYTFLRGFENWLSFDTNPLYAVLHEAIYCQGEASRWAAQRIREQKHLATKFDAVQAAREDRPVYFTGEMIFPWMFDELAGLRELKEVADILAEKADWGELYRTDVLRENNVPVAACCYYEDMYVDFGLSQGTAAGVKGLRLWVTSEFQHSGIREDGPRVLEKLLALASEQHPLN
ncbi:alpha/beta-Hydrolases superfamily protein [Klebsormidium nitens]|uniref:Alpha/beta-Hydrolases superfamily protein n=1 Tax=Klebsormidium nitens TaxID=105231 RepID=A0A1Y1I184_KLENI|nr:alpha/beta-Hydrolases superfamily protein [Klebsormidium nitens]|eukprot:GAQ81878.1 alpha/beta-Hydrolases superfamily protein [Klebsormidium nitens]